MAHNSPDSSDVPPPPSYEDAVAEEITVSGQALRIAVAEEEDEETALLKAELKRLQDENLEQKKRLLRQEIEKEQMKAAGHPLTEPSVTPSGPIMIMYPQHAGAPHIMGGADMGSQGSITYHAPVGYQPPQPQFGYQPPHAQVGSQPTPQPRADPNTAQSQNSNAVVQAQDTTGQDQDKESNNCCWCICYSVIVIIVFSIVYISLI